VREEGRVDASHGRKKTWSRGYVLAPSARDESQYNFIRLNS
jgi:hypothetical protein